MGIKMICLSMVILISNFVCAEEINELIINEITVEIPEFEIYLDIEDSFGEQIVDISQVRDNLRVVIDGTEAEILDVESSSNIPIAYTIGLDISKSLSQKEFEEVKNMLIDWVDLLGPNDHVALVTFGKEIRLVHKYDNDMVKVKEVINGLELTDNSTKLYEGVQMLHKYSNTTNYEVPRKKAIILISDGMDDYPGGITLEEVLEKIKVDSIPVYTIGVYNGTVTPTKQSYLDILGRFSRETYGRYYQKNLLSYKEIAENIESHLNRLFKVLAKSKDSVADGSQRLVLLEYRMDTKVYKKTSLVSFDTLMIDEEPPELLSITPIEIDKIELVFNEKILGYDNMDSYLFSGTNHKLVEVKYFNDPVVKVVLTFDGPFSVGEYSLRVNNITDISENRNEIVSKATVFNFDIEAKDEEEVDLIEISDTVSDEVLLEDDKKEGEGNRMTDLVMNIIAVIIVVVLLVLLVIRLKGNKEKEIKPKKVKKSKPVIEKKDKKPSGLNGDLKLPKKVPPIKRVEQSNLPKEEKVFEGPSSSYESGTVLLEDEDEGTVVLSDSNETVFSDDNLTVLGSYNQSTELLIPEKRLKIFVNGEIQHSKEIIIGQSIIIGRSDVCNLYINDEELSRQHAQIDSADDEFMITDLKSTNGTFVNMKRISQTQVLKDHDQIDLGKTKIRVEICEE